MLFRGDDPDPAEYKDRFPGFVDDSLLTELLLLRAEPENDPNRPRYQPIVLHDSGGFGEVFLAFDRELKQHVALKEVRLDHDEGENRDEFRLRLIREAQLARAVKPSVVPIYSLGHYDDGRPYYAMPFLLGDNLKQSIKDSGELTASRRRARWETRLAV